MSPVIYSLMTCQPPVLLLFEAHREVLLGSGWLFSKYLVMVSVKTYQCPLLTVKYFIFLFDKIGDPLQSTEVKKIQTKHKKQKKENVGESIKVIKLLTMDQQELWSMRRTSNKLGVCEIETEQREVQTHYTQQVEDNEGGAVTHKGVEQATQDQLSFKIKQEVTEIMDCKIKTTTKQAAQNWFSLSSSTFQKTGSEMSTLYPVVGVSINSATSNSTVI